jgi:serine phosphatase RsbU (regulator of sigma subunit)/Tfp pilus assembly protein PilF
MRKKYISRNITCLLAVMLQGLAAFAQQGKTDSLARVLKSAADDSSKVNLLTTLADETWQQGDYEKAMHFAEEAKLLADKVGFEKGKATAFINSALVYWKQGDYPKALEHAFTALRLNEAIGFKKGTARAHNCIGLIYYNQKNYTGALEEYTKALELRETIGDRKGVAGSLNNIGEVYKERKEYDKALLYFRRALPVNKETANRNWESININNIGTVYYSKGEVASPAGPDRNHFFTEALNYFYEALQIRKAIGDKQGIALSYISIGQVNARLGNNDTARSYYENALAFARSIGYKEAIKTSHAGLAVLDSTAGNWKAAFDHHRQYLIYRDSLLNEENTRRSIQAEMSFKFGQREEELQRQQAEEKQKQQLIIAAVSAGLVFALILALVILRSLRRNQEQNRIITAQKELVEKQKDIVDEKQKEITDSINYAERIQRSFLATDELLQKHLRDYFVFFKPRDVVSGDFYWAAALNDGSFLLVTADSTGHGVPGAIMSILNISCLEKAVEEKQLTGPAEILDYTRLKIIERLKKDGSADGGKDGMDCSVIRFDFKNNNAVYAAANNPVWIVRRNGEIKLLEFPPDKMPAGRHDRDQLPFTQHAMELQSGDMVYTITDGMPDQFGGPKGKKFMYKQLKELLMLIAALPLHEQKEKLDRAFTDWKGNLEQVDDVCVIGVRVS